MVRAALIEPFIPTVEIVEVGDDLLSLQRLISGGTMGVYVESVTLPGGILIVDEEGRLKGEPFNQIATALVRPLTGHEIVGRAALFGPVVDEELTSITPDWIERLLALGATIKEAT